MNTVMLNKGLIDEMVLTIFPIALGEGIRLFAPGAKRASFQTVGCETFETGLIQWRLAAGPPDEDASVIGEGSAAQGNIEGVRKRI